MLSPRWVMSDDADQFLMLGNRFLMIHHINFFASGMLTWRGALGNKIGDDDLQCKVYHSLHTITEEPDIKIFHKLLLNFEQQLQEHLETRNFAE